MKTATALLVACIVTAAPLLAQPNTMKRREDSVSVEGSRLALLDGVPVSHCALYAKREGKILPVPFQIDEINGKGMMALTGLNGKPVNPDDGKWDEIDELVFMCRDLGGRAGKEEMPPGATAVVEIACTDPLTGGTGWAYIASFAGPVKTEFESYVTYDPEKDYITAAQYDIGYTPGEMKSYFSTMIMKNGTASPGNVVDRFTFRISMSFLFGTVKIYRTEDDMSSKLVGYKTGPVKAVRECRNSLYLKFGISSPDATVYNYFYGNAAIWPTDLNMPFNVKTVATEASLDSGCNWDEAASGMRYFNALNADPVLVDGVMSEKEKKLDKSPYAWAVLTGDQGTLFNRVTFSPSLVMGKELLYLDDKAGDDKSNEEKGYWGYNGYCFDVLTITRGEHKFTSYFFFPSDYTPGSEKQLLDIVDNPIEVKTLSI